MKVLFLCDGNACRSQIAAAYLKKMRPDIEVCSAGIMPVNEIHWKNRAVAWEIGLELGESKHWRGYKDCQWDFVFAFSKEAFERVGFSDIIYIPIADPMPWGTREQFIKTRDAIIELVERMFE